MQVIAVAGQKGGAGKTTLAVNLAEAFRLAGRRVLLVDTDPQGSARIWADVAGEAGRTEAVPVLGTGGPALRNTLRGLEGSAELVVIDTPPRMAAEAKAAMAVAHLVLVPLAPGHTDVWALAKTLEVLTEVQAIRPDGGPPARAVLNRVDRRTGLSQALPEAATSAGMQVLKTELGNRVAYAEAVGAGESVASYDQGGKAAQEIEALRAEVEGLL